MQKQPGRPVWRRASFGDPKVRHLGEQTKGCRVPTMRTPQRLALVPRRSCNRRCVSRVYCIPPLHSTGPGGRSHSVQYGLVWRLQGDSREAADFRRIRGMYVCKSKKLKHPLCPGRHVLRPEGVYTTAVGGPARAREPGRARPSRRTTRLSVRLRARESRNRRTGGDTTRRETQARPCESYTAQRSVSL